MVFPVATVSRRLLYSLCTKGRLHHGDVLMWYDEGRLTMMKMVVMESGGVAAGIGEGDMSAWKTAASSKPPSLLLLHNNGRQVKFIL